ncbi:MAG: insulinase family protein [Desulfobacterales bacterium]|nr:insulinase family protein [Desulfobacterales bacterium]
MKKPVQIFLCLLIITGLGFSCLKKEPKVSSQAPLLQDPALVSGVLPNGFQYYLIENKTPKERVNIHLNVFAGSAHETEQEQGIAHYLEHMLFNGSEHFKPGELITYFQSIGMDFGADANARTSFYNTIYDLNLPKGDEKHLNDAFVVIKDYAQGALLLESEIDRERGVILAEKRERDSVSYRTFKKELAFEIPGSLLASRLPIGTTETIMAADKGVLKGFYDRWYRPDNMALVIVGDMDAKRTEKLIHNTFSSLKSRTDLVLADPDISWEAHTGTKVFFHSEEEAATTRITIEHLTYEPFKSETQEQFKQKATQYIADMMFQNRLSKMVKDQTGGFTSAAVYSGNYMKHLKIAAVQAECDPENWQSTLNQLSYSLRQALEFGFFPQELERVKADVLSSLDAEVEKAATRKSSAIARDLLNTLNRKGIFLSPEQERDLLAPHIKELSLEAVNDSFSAFWPNDHRLIMVTGNLDIPDNPEVKIEKAFTKSLSTKILPYTLVEKKSFPYLTLPEIRANVVNIVENAKNLGIRQVDLDNNIRINLKPTNFKKGEISFKAVFGKGQAGVPEKLFGLSGLAASATGLSGFGAMDSDELDLALAGKEVSIGFDIEDTYCSLSGQVAPGDVELVFQLLYAYFNDPGFRVKSLDLAKIRYRQNYDALRRTPDGVMRLSGSRFLAGGDIRFGLRPPQDIEQITIEDIETWLRPEFEITPLEVSIVGDFDVGKIENIAKNYLGAMNERAPIESLALVKDTPQFPRGENLTIRLETKLDKAVVRVSFLTDDYWDIMQTRRLSMLSRVFSERLRKSVREKLGASYSPYVYNNPSMIFEGYGVMNAVVNVAPDTIQPVYEQIEMLVADLVENGVTKEELDLVKAPLMNHLDVLRQNNSYWLNSVMANSFRYPERLDWANHLIQGYSNISPDELTKLARKYLSSRDSARIVVLPEAGISE